MFRNSQLKCVDYQTYALTIHSLYEKKFSTYDLVFALARFFFNLFNDMNKVILSM